MKGDFIIPKRTVEKIKAILFTDESIWWWVGFMIFFFAIAVALMAIAPIFGLYDLEHGEYISDLWYVSDIDETVYTPIADIRISTTPIYWRPVFTFLSLLGTLINIFGMYTIIGVFLCMIQMLFEDGETL